MPPAMAQYQGTHPLYQDIFIPAPPQTVEVHTRQDSYNAVFLSDEVRVFPDGTASGSLTLIPTNSASNPRIYYLGTGEANVVNVKWAKNGTVVRVLLGGETVDGDQILVSITPDASEDCLIYTTIGVEVHATWSAQGRIVVTR